MFLKPEQNVASLGLQYGMSVADFGAGSGFYTLALSKKVGNTGKVYAIEIQKDLLKTLENQIKESNISNVECIWGDIEKNIGTKLASNSMDAVVVSNVLFQVEDKLGLIDEAKRILKKDGKVLLVDWKESFNGMGPASHSVISEESSIELFKKRGFKVLEKISTLPHHYGIIFKDESRQ
jgi:FkbM family methyltransferase